jgi:hypothetical protein
MGLYKKLFLVDEAKVYLIKKKIVTGRNKDGRMGRDGGVDFWL